MLLTSNEGQAWIDACEAVKDMLPDVQLQTRILGQSGDIVDKGSKFEAAAGISGTGMILVRPDGVVAWRLRRLPADPQTELVQVMVKLFCR